MKNFFSKLGLKLQRFMYGRYGTDQLYRTLIWAYFAIMMLGLILGRTIDIKIYTIISILGFALIAFAFFRVFSKNIEKRRKENAKWLSFTAKIKKYFRIRKDRWKFRKTHIFRKCPKCRAVLRLKRIKGSHSVSCPHCNKSFKIKVFF